jgi:hypothetical protein
MTSHSFSGGFNLNLVDERLDDKLPTSSPPPQELIMALDESDHQMMEVQDMVSEKFEASEYAKDIYRVEEHTKKAVIERRNKRGGHQEHAGKEPEKKRDGSA